MKLDIGWNQYKIKRWLCDSEWACRRFAKYKVNLIVPMWVDNEKRTVTKRWCSECAHKYMTHLSNKAYHLQLITEPNDKSQEGKEERDVNLFSED